MKEICSSPSLSGFPFYPWGIVTFFTTVFLLEIMAALALGHLGMGFKKSRIFQYLLMAISAGQLHF